jgi:hypothetical protein
VQNKQSGKSLLAINFRIILLFIVFFQKPLAQELGMEKHSIFEIVRSFEATLIEPGVLVVPHCDKLINPRFAHSTNLQNLIIVLLVIKLNI